jgi:uncharacterized protein (TIGR02246 family)
VAWAAGLVQAVAGADAKPSDKKASDRTAGDKEQASLQAGLQAYVAAYNRGDAKAVADFWSDEGEWISPSGERMKGREAIRKGLEKLFGANRGVHLDVSDVKIRLVTPEVAVEEATAIVTGPDRAPDTANYIAIHVKRNGRWRLDSVRETETPTAAHVNEHLKALEWMVGEWVDQSEDSTVESSVRWTKNGHFLACSFRVSAPGQEDLEGTQVIGWDPSAKQIRSWIFDSDGGIGEGRWTRRGNHWNVSTTMTLPDGRKASSTNVYILADDGTYHWKSIGRQVDGQFLPNIDEVKVVRKETQQ